MVIAELFGRFLDAALSLGTNWQEVRGDINLFEEGEELHDGRVAVGVLVGRTIKANYEIPPLVNGRLLTVEIGQGGNRGRGSTHCQTR